MKKLSTFVNEQEYQTFSKKAGELELSEYALVKKIVLDYLLDGDVSNNSDDAARPYVKKVKTLKRQQKWALATIFVLSLYFVVSLAYILLF
jgi:hypothetical protein